jgi:hypothetical protein
MRNDPADIRALQVLGWLAADGDLLSVFLGASGTQPGELRARAEEPEFLASVVDFVLMDDAWVQACAQDLDWPPDALIRLRAELPGGDLPNWT